MGVYIFITFILFFGFYGIGRHITYKRNPIPNDVDYYTEHDLKLKREREMAIGSAVLAIIISTVLLVAAHGFRDWYSSSSKSGKSWSDLSEQEKQRARDSYELKKYIDEYNENNK